MNIQITHSHLKEFLSSKASPKQLEEYLSLCGPSIESVKKVKNDYAYDIELTTNRVDMMSVMGIARDASAILPQFNIPAKFNPPKLAQIIPPKNSLEIAIKDKNQTCRRIMGIILDNISLKKSTPKIKKRLKVAGIRSLNNAIDITNYVMTEIGHPTHIFDYDRIKTKKLILRYAKSGEKITSLENKTYSLPGGDIVIDDGTGNIIDLPGIIGTSNSVVINSTKRVLFFLETNDPIQIRKTSMNLGIRTMAASLNEKWVDPNLAITALKRGVKLFQDFTNAQIASDIIDIYPNPVKPETITANHQLIKNRLGINISTSKVQTILTSLGFENKYSKNKDQYTISIPSFRQKDINIPEDIVEEVARIYGYHRLPSKIMDSKIPTNYPDENFNLEHLIKTHLVGFGLTEIYTNSLISKNLTEQSDFPVESHLKIKNALSKDWQYLRRSLIPSHLETLNQPAKDLSFFEIAHTYHPQVNQLPEEKLQLIISTKKDYAYLKGILEALFIKLYLKINFKTQEKQAVIHYQNQLLGTMGPIGPFHIAVLNLKPILRLTRNYPKYQPLSSHPPVIEDLTFTLPQKTYLGPVIDTIKSTHIWIKKVKLTKTYHQNYTFNIIYQSTKLSLSDNLVTPVRKKVVKNLKTKHKAKLVGKL